MKLLNISNKRRDVYLFCRDDSGKQIILKDNSFYPTFYEPDQSGKEVGYDGVKLRKVIVNEPYNVPKYRSPASYSSDILFTKNYLINKIDKLDKTIIKYIFWDIEVLAKELPNYNEPIYPISCIAIYNSVYKKIQSFFLKDYKNEEELLCAFVNYIKKEKPDLLLAWNSDNFDYPYIFFRYKEVMDRDFSKDISPIHDNRRYFKIDNLYYPAGISVMDYLLLFKKVYMREQSYTLDHIGEKYTGKGKTYKELDFSKLTDEVKLRCEGDVQIMVDLENDKQLIPYFDEIRLLSKSLWEDLYHNSYIIENLLFEESKKKKIILPNCPSKNLKEEDTFEGAIRECIKMGLSFDVGKFDLSSAYPQMILNFCLDPQNISPKKEGVLVNNIYWMQNKDALLPTLINKILSLKNTLKSELKKQLPDSEEQKKAQIKYDAIKTIVNSAFGVTALSSFRYFNISVASTITFLVRELLMYVKDNIEKEGYKVIYFDTDSIFLDTKENIYEKLNNLIQQWAKEKYNKNNISIEFEYQGYFEKLFLVAKCRYYGYTKGSKKPEIKGIEAKRASSSKYEGEYQKQLLEKILNQNSKEEILKWIKSEKERIKTLPLVDISFPCKLTNKKYKAITIFNRAYENTKRINSKFNVGKGELFYYIFIDNPSTERNVLAFTEKNKDFLKDYKIDYDEVIRRNIDSKTKNIFTAMGWNYPIDGQISLF